MGNYKILIDSTEFMQMVLEYITSDEFNEMVDSTIYKDDSKYKQAVAYGMAIASMLTSRCNLYYQNTCEQDGTHKNDDKYTPVIETLIGLDNHDEIKDYQSRVLRVKSWDEFCDAFKNYRGEAIEFQAAGIKGASIPKGSHLFSLDYNSRQLSCKFVDGYGRLCKVLAYKIFDK